ncbi:unnamed protein product [Boreogadus saida]
MSKPIGLPSPWFPSHESTQTHEKASLRGSLSGRDASIGPGQPEDSHPTSHPHLRALLQQQQPCPTMHHSTTLTPGVGSCQSGTLSWLSGFWTPRGGYTVICALNQQAAGRGPARRQGPGSPAGWSDFLSGVMTGTGPRDQGWAPEEHRGGLAANRRLPVAGFQSLLFREEPRMDLSLSELDSGVQECSAVALGYRGRGRPRDFRNMSTSPPPPSHPPFP